MEEPAIAATIPDIPTLTTPVSNISTGENAEVHFFRRTSLLSVCSNYYNNDALQIARKDTGLNIWDDFGNKNKMYNIQPQDGSSEDITTDDDFENQIEKIPDVKNETQNQNIDANTNKTVADNVICDEQNKIEETFIVEKPNEEISQETNVPVNKSVSENKNIHLNINSVPITVSMEQQLQIESSILQMVGSPIGIVSMKLIDQNKLDERFYFQQQCQINKQRSNKIKLKTICKNNKKHNNIEQKEVKDNNNECVNNINRSEHIETNKNVHTTLCVPKLKYVAAFCAVVTVAFIIGNVVYKRVKIPKEDGF